LAAPAGLSLCTDTFVIRRNSPW